MLLQILPGVKLKGDLLRRARNMVLVNIDEKKDKITFNEYLMLLCSRKLGENNMKAMFATCFLPRSTEVSFDLNHGCSRTLSSFLLF